MSSLISSGRFLPAPARLPVNRVAEFVPFGRLNPRQVSPHHGQKYSAQNMPLTLVIRYRYSRHLIPVLLAPTQTSNQEALQVPEEVTPDQLSVACFIGGSKISLRFADNFICTLDLAQLGIDASKLKLETAHASWGSAIEVEDVGGKAIHIDSAVLRAYCDPQFAAELKESIAEAG